MVDNALKAADIIDDFIYNNLSDYYLQDLYANPQDIYEDEYEELKDFAINFLEHFDISLDII